MLKLGRRVSIIELGRGLLSKLAERRSARCQWLFQYYFPRRRCKIAPNKFARDVRRFRRYIYIR